jgi:hypothetical protein
MTLIIMIRREETRLQNELQKTQKQLFAVRQAAAALNDSPQQQPKKRHLSAAGKARIVQAAKRRWAKFHAKKSAR